LVSADGFQISVLRQAFSVTCHLTATMSYDLYLYKSNLSNPDIDDASQVIEDDKDIWAKKPYNYQTKTSIEKALMTVDTDLEAFDYEQLAKKQGKTIDEVKGSFMKFELRSNDIDINIEIYDYHVAITIPYRYKGSEAQKAFEMVNLYADTIIKVVNYFVYNPQSGEAFDLKIKKLDGLSKYLSVSTDFETIMSSSKTTQEKKTWWKIW